MLTVLFQHLLHPGHHSTLQIALISDQYHLGLGPECTSSKQFNLQVAYTIYHRWHSMQLLQEQIPSVNTCAPLVHPTCQSIRALQVKLPPNYADHPGPAPHTGGSAHMPPKICRTHTQPSYLRSWAITQATHMGARPVVKL